MRESGDEIELICDGEDEEEAMKAWLKQLNPGLASKRTQRGRLENAIQNSII